MSAESHETGGTPIDNVEDETALSADSPDEHSATVPDDDTLASAEDDRPSDDIELDYRRALEAIEAVENAVELQGGFGAGPVEAEASLDCSDSPQPAVPATETIPTQSGPAHPGVTPQQIIEAALFVGGTPLTIKRIGMLLRNEFDQDFVENTIDSLNSTYAEEQRPYEITFGEGGYRMVLRSEFERLRSRAYGFGPKEVKLSQDALEVLALVAYRQPVSAAQIEEAGKSNPGSILRLLVRRQLFAIERCGKKRADVKYRTTPRFLELFGLGDLDELPQSIDDLNFK
jgi:segregation and condensation protein B